MPTALDAILIIIMMLSGFLAMLRGLTREVLSIMSWALAALAALFVYPIYRDRIRQLMEQQLLADGVLIVSVFVVVLIVVNLVTARLSDRVLDSRVGAIDRTLGFVFGLVRGLLIVVIAYELYAAIVPKESQPFWVAEARSMRIIQPTGAAIRSVLPDNPFSLWAKKDHQTSIMGSGNLAGISMTKINFIWSHWDYKTRGVA